jgi:hypothetical protein
MKWVAYFLILLVISAQVDDAWVPAALSEATPAADENDSYLPAPRHSREEPSGGPRKLLFVGLHGRGADQVHRRNVARRERDLTTPCTPPPLYVFMSLQI